MTHANISAPDDINIFLTGFANANFLIILNQFSVLLELSNYNSSSWQKTTTTKTTKIFIYLFIFHQDDCKCIPFIMFSQY